MPHIDITMIAGRDDTAKKRNCRKNTAVSCRRTEH